MLKKIEKILVVINETERITPLLQKAIKINDTHKAVLEILFVHETTLFSIPSYFKPDGSKNIDKDRIKEEIETSLTALGNTAAYIIFVEESDTADRINALNTEVQHSCILSFFNDTLSAELAKKVSSPLLIMKAETSEYRQVIFPVDLNENNIAFIQDIKTLFPDVQTKLLFEPSFVAENYIFDTDLTMLPLDSTVDPTLELKMLQQQKEAFEELKKRTGLSGEIIDETETDIVTYINTQKPDLVVLHSQNENFLFDDTLSKELFSSINADLLIF